MPAQSAHVPSRARWLWYLLLLPPYFLMLWVPSFNRIEPTLGGIPFFYWYQLLWVVIAAVLTGGVYLATVNRR